MNLSLYKHWLRQDTLSMRGCECLTIEDYHKLGYQDLPQAHVLKLIIGPASRSRHIRFYYAQLGAIRYKAWPSYQGQACMAWHA
jgi:hypothetical protein